MQGARKVQKTRAFTLIELVFVIVILSIIAAIGSRVMGAAFQSYYDNQNIIIANAQGRIALERMIRDVHAIASPSSITTATSSSLSFTDVNGNTVTYGLSGTTLQRNGIALADGIGSIEFRYYDGNGATTAVTTNIRYINVILGVTELGVNYTLKTTMATLNYI